MNVIVLGIFACEIGFWVVLFLGLAARYLLRWRKTSNILLLCIPLLDVALLALIAWDLLANNTVADFTHGLGAIYLGFTIAFGHSIILRVDAWFAHRFAGGPAPVKPPKTGILRVRHEWREWLRMLLCAVITTAVLGAIIWLVQDPTRTEELTVWILRTWLVTGIWFIGWPVWVSVAHLIKPEAKPQ